MSDDLTSRQREALETFSELARGRGFCPSVREMGDALEISSTNGVSDLLRPLVRKGYLTHEPLRARSYTLTRKGQVTLGLGTRSKIQLAAEKALVALVGIRDLPSHGLLSLPPSLRGEVWAALRALDEAGIR